MIDPQTMNLTMQVTSIVTFVLGFALMIYDMGVLVYGLVTGKSEFYTVSDFIISKVGYQAPYCMFWLGATASHLCWYMYPVQCEANTLERFQYAICGASIAVIVTSLWNQTKKKSHVY